MFTTSKIIDINDIDPPYVPHTEKLHTAVVKTTLYSLGTHACLTERPVLKTNGWNMFTVCLVHTHTQSDSLGDSIPYLNVIVTPETLQVCVFPTADSFARCSEHAHTSASHGAESGRVSGVS